MSELEEIELWEGYSEWLDEQADRFAYELGPEN
jgi:hypothetical protein